MEPNNHLTDHKSKEQCDSATCVFCKQCKVVNYEETRTEWENDSLQLYARELEHYFFYYAAGSKQMETSL